MIWRDVVASQFRHQETERIPYTLHFEQETCQRLTEHFGSESWMERLDPAICTVGHFDTWDTFAFVDDKTAVDAYGSIWLRSDTCMALKTPVLEQTDWSSYTMPPTERFADEAAMAGMRETLAANTHRYPVAMIGAGMYELSWRLLGVEEALVSMLADPEMYEDILDKLLALLCAFVDKACTLPVEAVMLGDDWCDQRGLIMGKPLWDRMFKPRMETLYRYIHEKGKKTITHVCGNVAPLLPDLIEIGLDVLESVQPEPVDMEPLGLKRTFGDRLAFWGGLGCQGLITFGSPQEITDEVNRLKREMSAGGGYVLAPTKTIPGVVPVENALAILDAFTAT